MTNKSRVVSGPAKISSYTYDKRNTITKLPIIIKNLREFGYKVGSKIPYDDVEYAIQLTRGLDFRTIRKYIRLLTQLNFLKPASKRTVQTKKVVSVKTGSGTRTKIYRVDKGYAFYSFGPRVPKRYEETLNPKYVPPSPSPPPIIDERVKVEKNMYVSHREGEREKQNGLKRFKESVSNKIINNNNCLTHTYSLGRGTRSSESNRLSENDPGKARETVVSPKDLFNEVPEKTGIPSPDHQRLSESNRSGESNKSSESNHRSLFKRAGLSRVKEGSS